MNQVKLTSSLWLFAIHSQNAELIHLLEDDKVKLKDVYYDENNYEYLFIESINCHHNNITHYIEDNFVPLSENKPNYLGIISYIFSNHNYEFFPNNFNDDEFYVLYKYNYKKILDLYIEEKEKNLDEEIKRQNYNFIKTAKKKQT